MPTVQLYDTLTYNGIERTLGGWGFDLNSCRQRRGTGKADTWTGRIPTATIASAPLFPYKASVILQTARQSTTGADNSFSAGTIKFQGKRVLNPLKGAAKQYSTYEFHGPWFDLDITQYLQTYKGQTTNYNPGEVVLNTAAAPFISTAGLRFISMGDQVQGILQFVLDGYAAQGLPAPFQYTGRALLNGAINLDVTGNAGTPNQNTDEQANIYNLKLQANNTIDTALYKNFLKSEILRPMSAAQMLQKLLDSTPRTNIAFDYTTTPPTCYVMNVDNLLAQSLPLFDGVSHESLDIQRRDDLIPASVIIGYRITETINGNSVVDYVVDKYGPNGVNSNADPSTGPSVIVQILDLQGSTVSFTNANLDCEPLAAIGGTQATKRAWWASKRGGELAKLEDTRVRFQDASGNATTIADAHIYYASNGFDSTGAAVVAGQEFTAADYAFFTNRLVRGTQHAWMTLQSGAAVKSVKVKIATAMQFAEYDATSAANSETDTNGTVLRRHNSTDQQHINCELTNGVTGGYSTIASAEAGESFIIGNGGIAQYLFNMLSVLQYEGEYAKVETNFANNISLLNRANFTGGLAEWTTMNAQIQEIEEDWGRKETRVRIGIAKHLTAQQLSAFLNMWRFRRPWYNPQLKADNTVNQSGEVEMPVTNGQSNTVEGLENVSNQSLMNYVTPPSGSTPGVIKSGIDLNALKAAFFDNLNQ